MGIMAFLPDYAGADENELKLRGLAELCEPSLTAIFTPCAKGPAGGPGKLVTFYPGNDPREYNAESQTWLEALPFDELPAGRYWVGYVTAQKPTPEDLQRRDLIGGDAVLLDDGKVWIVPCSDYAPTRCTRDRATGRDIEVVKEQHRRWVEWSNVLFEQIIAEGYATLGDADCVIAIPGGLTYAAMSLSKNYRVNADIVDLLQLIDKHSISDVVLAATGITRLAQLVDQKKNVDASCQAAATN